MNRGEQLIMAEGANLGHQRRLEQQEKARQEAPSPVDIDDTDEAQPVSLQVGTSPQNPFMIAASINAHSPREELIKIKEVLVPHRNNTFLGRHRYNTEGIMDMSRQKLSDESEVEDSQNKNKFLPR